MREIEVSIILVHYKTLELTTNVIKSIYKKTKEVIFEIIVVDNASNDGSIEKIERKFKNKIKIIKNNENIGFGRANNIGVKEAKGKYIFLLNTDTILINNAIKILFEFIEKNKKIAVVGGNLYTKDLKPAHSFSRKKLRIRDELINPIRIKIKNILGLKREDFNYTSLPEKVEIITGADMLIRKNIFFKIGGFDKEFFMYHEESELCNRINNLGYEIYSIPEAKIIHLEGKSSIFKEKQFKNSRFGKYLYFYKINKKNKLKWIYFFSQIKYIMMFNLNKYKINKNVYKEFCNKFL